MEPSIRNNIGLDPEIRRLNRKPLSDADLRRILGNDTKILKYAELASVPALTQLLPKPTDYCIILYESEMNSGHWVACCSATATSLNTLTPTDIWWTGPSVGSPRQSGSS